MEPARIQTIRIMIAVMIRVRLLSEFSSLVTDSDYTSLSETSWMVYPPLGNNKVVHIGPAYCC